MRHARVWLEWDTSRTSDLQHAELDLERLGVCIGSAAGGLELVLEQDAYRRESGWKHVALTLPSELPVEQRDRLAEIAERTPVTLAVRAGTPITTTIRTTPAASPSSPVS